MNLVNTTSKVRKQEISVDAVALFDILLIALMMTLLGSKFVSSPGLGLELGAGKDLPKMASPDGAITDSDINVLSARGEAMLIFDGAIYPVASFRRHFCTILPYKPPDKAELPDKRCAKPWRGHSLPCTQ